MAIEVGIADLAAMAMEVDMGDLAAMADGIDIGATGGGDNSGDLAGGGPIPSQQVSLVISTPQRLSLQ